MKKSKRYLLLGMTAASLFLSGCGTPLFELTEEEKLLIIQSAAYYVAKHNIQQKDGVSNIIIEEEESESESVSESEIPTETESEGSTENSGGGSSEGDGTTQEGITFAQAIGHGSDLKVTYEGSYLEDHYVEGSAYSVDAPAGYTYYVMKIKMTNPTDNAVKVNNISLNPIFKLKSGTMTLRAEVTILNSDFSTYVGTIEAGESADAILLFEVQESKAESIKDPSLYITVGDDTNKVKL